MELPEGRVFCDPTLSGAPAGMISPNDADRDVLLVREPEQWLHTPPQECGRFGLNFESKVAPTGEISGWVTLEAEGYLATRYADIEARSTRQQIKERMSQKVEGCFPGANLVDVKLMPRSSDGAYRIQAYYVAPPTGALVLPFPLDAAYLPDLGDGNKRETDAFLWRDRVTTTSTFTLPEGFRPASLPPAHSFKFPLAQGEARWEQAGSILKCLFDYRTESSRVAAADCRSFAQALGAFRAWLAKPVTLELGKGPVTTPTAADELGEFPLMPSGEGQLALVNRRFPSNGNARLRRLALEKTLSLFPQDKQVQFNAQVQLAFLDTVEGEHDSALQRLRGPLESLRGSVDVREAALGDYVQGLALKNKGSTAEALKVFEKLIAAKDVAAFRRAWAQNQRSLILAKSDPLTAIAAAEEGIKLGDGVEPVLYAQLAALRLERREENKLATHLKSWLEKQPASAAEVMIKLAELAHDLFVERPAQATALLKVLEGCGDPAVYGGEFADTLARARAGADAANAYVTVQERLKEWVASHPNALPGTPPPDSLKTLDDFTKEIEQTLKEDNNGDKAAQLVRLDVESLIRFTPDEGFGGRLWHAASCSDFQDRTDETPQPPALLFVLLDLCDLLPAESDGWVDGRFLRAQVLKRTDNLEEAGRVLRGLAEDTKLPEGFKASAFGRYGRNCLERKDYPAALKAWRGLEHHLDAESAPSNLLRAIFVALETNRRDDALWFLSLLRKVPSESIEKSQDAEHLRSFLKFAKDDSTAEEWWDTSAKWWPAWLALERDHDKPIPPGDLIVPMIPSVRDCGTAFGKAGRAGSRSEAFSRLREMVHAARWQPLFAAETAGLIQYFPQPGLDTLQSDFRKFVIIMNEAGGDAPELRPLRLWAAASLIDEGKVDPVPDLVRKFLATDVQQDKLTVVMVRLWAIAAVQTGKDLPDVATQLERFLKKPPPGDSRHSTVAELAAVYRKQGRTADEKQLLEAELLNPETVKDASAVEELRQRLEVLRENGGSGDGPALAANACLAIRKPGWFDFARPRDLKDAKAARPDEAIRPGASLLPSEALKLCLLIAMDSSQPEERRASAISNLGWHICATTNDASLATAWMEAITKEKSLSRRLRGSSLDAFVRCAFVRDDRVLLSKFITDSLLDAFTEEEMPYRKVLRDYAEIAPTDLDAALRLGNELVEGTLDYFAAESLERMIKRLAFGARVTDARRLYESLGKARFSERISRDRSAYQLTALKTINLAMKLNPVQDAMRDLYLHHHAVSSEKPEAAIPWRNDVELNLPQSEATAVREAWITAGTWPRENLHFWFQLARDLPNVPKTEDLRLALLELAFEKSPDDDTRASLIVLCAGLVDIDNAATRARLEAVVKPYRNLADSPVTQNALRAHDLQVRLRTGAPVDPFSSLAAITDTRILQQARWAVFRSCLANRDIAALKRIVETVSTEELLSPMNATLAVQTYRLLGMKDEAELAADRAREAVYDFVMASWTRLGTPPPHLALHIAATLGEPSLVPPAFEQEMAAAIRHERERLFFLAQSSQLRGRWQECAEHAAEGRKLYPTYYDFHRFEGMALGHLGRKKEAAALLKTYLEYGRNDPEAVEAREMLSSLEK